MPVPLTQGNDDNALETLVSDARVAFAASANTHQNIDALADMVDVDLTNLQGDDRWMLELLAAEVVVEPLTWCQIDGRYRLNAPAEDLIAMGITGKLAMSNDDQTGTYTVQGGLAVYSSYSAMPAGMLTMSAETLDFSTGKTAIQFALSAPTIAGGAGVEKMAVIGNVMGAGGVVAQVSLRPLDNGTHGIAVQGAAGAYLYGAANNPVAHPSDSAVVTIEFDADAGTFAVRIDGALIVLSNDEFTPGPCRVMIGVNENKNIPPAYAGLTAVTTLRTRAVEYTGNVSAGFTDPCGNLIGA